MAAWNIIDHTELTGTATTYTKSSIPSSYEHLYFLVSARNNTSSIDINNTFYFNNSTAADYSYTTLFTQLTGTTISAGVSNAQSHIIGVYSAGSTVFNDTFAVTEIWIPNYSNTSNWKQAVIKNVVPNDSTSDYNRRVMNVAGLWQSTAAINRIDLVASSGSFMAESTFTLYGINGA
tara:strand:+ start:1456 stop:1986 length:531 start_codon:yes stop_codon:yes gene_type:complete